MTDGARRLPVPFVLARQHWLVAALVIMVLMAATVLVFHPFLDEFVWERLLASRLEKRLAFRGARKAVADPSGKVVEVYYLADVTPNGPLHRAGFRAGHIPFGGMHGQAAYFLRVLDEACQRPREVSVWLDHPWSEPPTRVRVPCVP